MRIDRIDFSITQRIPDFTMGEMNRALEVKFCKKPSDTSRIIDEIGADITCWVSSILQKEATPARMC